MNYCSSIKKFKGIKQKIVIEEGKGFFEIIIIH